MAEDLAYRTSIAIDNALRDTAADAATVRKAEADRPPLAPRALW